MNVASKAKDKWDKHQFKKLERDTMKYRSFQNEYTLKVNEEEEWYHMTLDRLKRIKGKPTVEILQELLNNVQYHPEIKKRIKKQIKELKEVSNKTIEDCLYEVMQGYVSKKDDATQTSALTRIEDHYNKNKDIATRNEQANEPKNDKV